MNAEERYRNEAHVLTKERDEAVAKVARLREENERLLVALQRLLSMGQPECQFTDEARAAIAAATGTETTDG